MRLVTWICRWVSSGFTAIALSGMGFLLCNLIYDRFQLQQRLGIDDDVCWLTLPAGMLSIFFFHRKYHSIRWMPWIFTASGILGVVGAVIIFTRMEAASKAHVPTGAFSGIGYGILQLMSIYAGFSAFAAVLGGVLGILAQRMDKAAKQVS